MRKEKKKKNSEVIGEKAIKMAMWKTNKKWLWIGGRKQENRNKIKQEKRKVKNFVKWF